MDTPPNDPTALSVPVTRARVWTRRVALRSPMGNARRTVSSRTLSVVELTDDTNRSGWGESVALPEAMYVGPSDVQTTQLLSGRAGAVAQGHIAIGELDVRIGTLSTNPYARAAVEAALWHLLAQRLGLPLWKLWGGTTTSIEFGSNIAVDLDVDSALRTARQKVASGARRLRVKISPRTDLAVIESLIGELDLEVTVDANGSYDPDDPADIDALSKLDSLGVSGLEQPFDHRRPDTLEHCARLASTLQSPICLDESIDSVATAHRALEMGACRAVNVKAGRLGGFANALELLSLITSHKAQAWCGGMYETDLGRAFNLNLMSRTEFEVPGDGDAPSLLYDVATTEPRVGPDNGRYQLDDTPGLGGWEAVELSTSRGWSVAR